MKKKKQIKHKPRTTTQQKAQRARRARERANKPLQVYVDHGVLTMTIGEETLARWEQRTDVDTFIAGIERELETTSLIADMLTQACANVALYSELAGKCTAEPAFEPPIADVLADMANGVS